MSDSPLPVDNSIPEIPSVFFAQGPAINAELWDKYAPYQLVIVEAMGSGPDYSYVGTSFRFTLPIPPQELNLSMPIATNMQATMTGVSIQHGGAPFRDIALQGTTGISPAKKRGASLGTFFQGLFGGIPNAIFGGTVQNTRAVVTDARRATIGSGTPNVSSGLTTNPNDDDRIDQTSTGYYQMRQMERFIEAWIALKTRANTTSNQSQTNIGNKLTKASSSYRLAFCMWKDEAVYLVEPLQFIKRRSASNPMEYMFSLNLRAYKRVKLGTSGVNPFSSSSGPLTTINRKPNLVAQILNRFRAARALVTDLDASIKSVVSDPNNLMEEALRETGLFLGAASGLKMTISDFEDNVKSAARFAAQQQWPQIRNNLAHLISADLDTALISGLPSNITDALKAEFDKILAPKISIDSLRLTADIRRKIATEIARVKNLGRADFEAHRDLILSTATDYADRVGAGNVVFNQTFNRQPPDLTRTPSDTDMDVLYSLNECAILLDHLAISSQIDPSTPTSIEYVAGLAQASGIAFKTPQSKFAVPFPYGGSLEGLALQYLGDANRWHEIATLNGLREPYVDEVGFSMPLLTNGSSNVITLSSSTNLYQGQTVWLSANGVRRQKRHIIKIEALTPTQVAITLDGAPTLDVFTTTGNAVLETFLPATVNSTQSIYIPSQQAAPEDPETKDVPGVDAFDPLLQISGIDLLLTSDGDLAITPDGDCRLAYGLANIVQSVKIALSTPKGSLLQHPEFGLEIPIGVSTAELDANTLLQQVKAMFSNDPMFSGVRSASVQKAGPVVVISIEVGIAGTSQFVPITVNVR